MPTTYTKWTRDEIERAFEEYQRVALECGQTGKWEPWCELFTLDCTYIEAQAGRIGGREALKRLYRTSSRSSRPATSSTRRSSGTWSTSSAAGCRPASGSA
jgi:hypothetical protein